MVDTAGTTTNGSSNTMKSTRSLFVTILACLAAIVFGATSASAAVTVKSPPVAAFDGASVTVSGGNFSGLGNIPAYGQVTVTGQANYICTNPSGKVVPGQNPVAAQSGVSPLVQLATDKNGRATIPPITATVTAPPTPSAQQVGCGGTGNTQWTVTLSSLQATAAHLLVTQNGQQVYCRDYTLTGPSTGTAC
jgi:hypothetical protein